MFVVPFHIADNLMGYFDAIFDLLFSLPSPVVLFLLFVFFLVYSLGSAVHEDKKE